MLHTIKGSFRNPHKAEETTLPFIKQNMGKGTSYTPGIYSTWFPTKPSLPATRGEVFGGI